MEKKEAIKEKKVELPVVSKIVPEKIAVIKTGGKQYLVKEGIELKVELLKDQKILNFDDILNGYKVSAEIIETKKSDKVIVFKYKNKTGRRKNKGHRQIMTKIKITKIA
ncbi:MAG: 50S ribosomal protein L21 [Berkelbacteria bacterium GW2011_GWA2_35_9]|uniref:50S ribosomal protein L21 n=1 Tax=Berkelbacteria bacterium GW2011_GWA2_35_9 TaxID=1618333 RepID=A0A0G0D3X0_9BACT|nr:MAG: 50S ribosomal protein L21 [Berkelbacteria bacterium GW2011_GWA2_35_9]